MISSKKEMRPVLAHRTTSPTIARTMKGATIDHDIERILRQVAIRPRH